MFTSFWPISKNSCEASVGVENGYDEVNIQIPEEEKRRNPLRQILFQNRFFFTKNFEEETRVVGQELKKGRYAATELEPELATELEPKFGRYVAIERSVAT